MKIVNIYGQEAWHEEARIIGNLEGLTELRDTLDRAIATGNSETNDTDDPVFASDGEGYVIEVKRIDDVLQTRDSEWYTEGNRPQYLLLERGL